MARKRKDEDQKPEAENLVEEISYEVIEEELPVIEQKPIRKGIVLLVLPHRVVYVVDGMGEEIPFDSDKHSHLKIGDQIEVI